MREGARALPEIRKHAREDTQALPEDLKRAVDTQAVLGISWQALEDGRAASEDMQVCILGPSRLEEDVL